MANICEAIRLSAKTEPPRFLIFPALLLSECSSPYPINYKWTPPPKVWNLQTQKVQRVCTPAIVALVCSLSRLSLLLFLLTASPLLKSLPVHSPTQGRAPWKEFPWPASCLISVLGTQFIGQLIGFLTFILTQIRWVLASTLFSHSPQIPNSFRAPSSLSLHDHSNWMKVDTKKSFQSPEMSCFGMSQYFSFFRVSTL